MKKILMHNEKSNFIVIDITSEMSRVGKSLAGFRDGIWKIFRSKVRVSGGKKSRFRFQVTH